MSVFSQDFGRLFGKHGILAKRNGGHETGVQSGSRHETGVQSGSRQETSVQSGSRQETGVQSGSRQETGVQSGSRHETGVQWGSRQVILDAQPRKRKSRPPFVDLALPNRSPLFGLIGRRTERSRQDPLTTVVPLSELLSSDGGGDFYVVLYNGERGNAVAEEARSPTPTITCILSAFVRPQNLLCGLRYGFLI